MTNFLEILIIGLSLGAAFSLLALSINVIYSTSNILNFAQGEFMMLGGMLGWVFFTVLGLPYPLAFVGVALATGVVGAVEYVLVVWPLQRQRAPIISIIIATLGFSIALRIVTSLFLGRVQRFARPPLGQDALEILGLTVLPQNVLILAITGVALAVSWWIYARTTVGLALRAAALNPDGARLVGIRIRLLMLLTFAGGGAVAGIAGLILSPLSYASPWLGLNFAILGFAAAIVGGLGSWPGAVIGGTAIGITQALALRYLSSQWGDMVTFVLLLLVLYLRPTGLFSERASATSGTQ
jgi:branched-chain amino acid transport system permease protein